MSNSEWERVFHITDGQTMSITSSDGWLCRKLRHGDPLFYLPSSPPYVGTIDNKVYVLTQKQADDFDKGVLRWETQKEAVVKMLRNAKAK